MKLKVPLVVRLEGTNVDVGKTILKVQKLCSQHHATLSRSTGIPACKLDSLVGLLLVINLWNAVLLGAGKWDDHYYS